LKAKSADIVGSVAAGAIGIMTGAEDPVEVIAFADNA